MSIEYARDAYGKVPVIGAELVTKRNAHELSIITWNVGGIQLVSEDVGALLLNSNFDVVCLQETHHDSRKIESWMQQRNWRELGKVYDIFWSKTDYKVEHQSIANQNHHGVATLVKKGFNAKYTSPKWHIMKCTLQKKNTNWTIINVYVPCKQKGKAVDRNLAKPVWIDDQGTESVILAAVQEAKLSQKCMHNNTVVCGDFNPGNNR